MQNQGADAGRALAHKYNILITMKQEATLEHKHDSEKHADHTENLVNVDENLAHKVHGKESRESKESKADKKPFKVLAVSDTHGDMKKIRELADVASKEKVDLVVLAGDWSNNDEIPPYLISPFLKEGRRVVFVPGNHESMSTTYFLSDLYKIKHLHGKATIYGDIGFFGAGGANMGPHPMNDDEIFYQLKKSFQEIKDAKTKVMVTHAHPSGTKMEKFTQIFPGSDAVRRAIDEFKPDIVLCGHVHEAEGIEEMIGKTKVINVAKSGKILEFN